MGRADIARLLLDAGANVSANTTSVRRTPLHWAARNGHTDAVHLLLRRGAQTASQDTDGSAPLHLAAAQGGVDVARLLLEVGADVSARRRGGFTPLHLSARVGNVHVTALLIERGADVLCVTQARPPGRAGARMRAADAPRRRTAGRRCTAPRWRASWGLCACSSSAALTPICPLWCARWQRHARGAAARAHAPATRPLCRRDARPWTWRVTTRRES